MIRNTFYDVGHIAQVKDAAFLTFVNNTAYDVTASAIYFLRPGGTGAPGHGAYLDGNIFANTAEIFEDVLPTTELTVNHSLLPAEWHGYGRERRWGCSPGGSRRGRL